MQLQDLVATSLKVGRTSSRLEKVDLLATLLARVQPEEIPTAIALLSGSLPHGRVGVGYAAMRDATLPDPPDAATLTLADVSRTFETIAQASGKGSAGEKRRALGELLSRATTDERDFLLRLVMGELRQGALEGLMVEAVARARNIPANRVRRALLTAGDLRTVARTAFEEGDAGLQRFAVQLLRPLQPMLAQPAEEIDSAIRQFGETALEFKLDGARVQIHKAGDVVRVFSRTLREVTAAVPELVEAINALPVREAILDGEVIALKPDQSPHPFQVTMARFGRKLDIGRQRAELPLSTFAFDLLYLDGHSLLDEPHARRFDALRDILPPSLLIPYLVTGDPAAARRFQEEALGRGHEGVMAKDRMAPYEAGRRGSTWLKIKPTHTLDLVVLAAEWGHGRRRGWLSNLHLGARDEASPGTFVMLGKTFKGMTDEMLAWQTRKLQELEIARDEYTVYVRPELVVEIAFSDVQQSSRYPGGMALRFARVKRYRPDKRAAEADTIATVRRIWDGQTGRRADGQ